MRRHQSSRQIPRETANVASKRTPLRGVQRRPIGRKTKMKKHSIRNTLLAASMLAALPAFGADVTPERLANPDKEPQNWLMNHRSYDAQRYSPLARINKDNVKNLKLAYAVPIGGTAINENLQATPLVEDGYMYVVDQWGIVYK